MKAWMFPYLLCMILISTAAHAATYYVSTSGNDSNPGTQASPWRTIVHAAATMTAGDTTIVQPGTYQESYITFRNTSGTAGAPIILKGAEQWAGPGSGTTPTAVIASRSGCSPNIGVYANYVTIQDLRFTMSANNVACGTLTSNIPAAIRGWVNNLPHATGPTTTDFHNLTIRRVYVDYSPNMALGIKTSLDDSLVEFSEINNSLEEMASNGTVFRNNILRNADVFGSTLTSKGGARNFQAYNNVIHITMPDWNEGLVLGGTSGAQFDWDPSTGIECYNCIAYNNVVINETSTPRSLFLLAACQDCVISNNVGINGSLEMRGGGGSTATSPNPTWKNNLLSCNGSQAKSGWNGSGTVTVDYNDFYQCSGVPAQAHAITGNPLFVNPASDWHLQATSPALNTGTTVTATRYNGTAHTGLNVSYDGVTRTTPWSLGIYSGSGGGDTSPPARPTNLRVQ